MVEQVENVPPGFGTEEFGDVLPSLESNVDLG